jgi:hypothetical protein
MNGPEIKPPVYEKKVGRPTKSRRKQPYEVQGKHGPKLTKHGVQITCSHCKGLGHNSKGRKLRKDGISSLEAKKMVEAAALEQAETATEEPLQIEQAEQVHILCYVFKFFVRNCNVINVCINNPLCRM